MKRLPKKLSDRILVALADLEACEKDPNYEIDMYIWHQPKGKVCEVCLSGAVMAKTLKLSRDIDTSPEFLPGELSKQLLELDEVRCGRLNNEWFDSDEGGWLDDASQFNRTYWLPFMLDIVGRLKAEGK